MEVKFDIDEQIHQSNALHSSKKLSYQEMLVKYRIVKNEQQAIYVLIGVIVIAISASLVLLFSGSKYKNINTHNKNSFVPAETL